MRALQNENPRREVRFLGVRYETDVRACRDAQTRRQAAGYFTSMEGLADAAGISRTVAHRFFTGHVGLESALAVQEVLGLDFDATDMRTRNRERLDATRAHSRCRWCLDQPASQARSSCR